MSYEWTIVIGWIVYIAFGAALIGALYALENIDDDDPFLIVLVIAIWPLVAILMIYGAARGATKAMMRGKAKEPGQ